MSFLLNSRSIVRPNQSPVFKMAGLCFGFMLILTLYGCGDSGGSEKGLNMPSIEQVALTQQDIDSLRDQCVSGQMARINMGLNFCLMANIRPDEYCHSCEEAEWQNVEARFNDIQADARSRYDLCMTDPATKTGFFDGDYCRAMYFDVFQQRMSECRNSLYCFNI